MLLKSHRRRTMKLRKTKRIIIKGKVYAYTERIIPLDK